MARPIANTITNRKTHPYQAKKLSKKANVSVRRSGASQNSLFGKLSFDTGLSAILLDTQNSIANAGRNTTAYRNMNCDFVIQPFGIPKALKCEASRSGSSGKS